MFIVDSLLCLLDPLLLLQKYDECLEKILYGQKILETLTALTEKKKSFRKALFINKTGTVYFMKKDFNTALNIFEEAINIFKSLDETVATATTLHNIGMIYHLRGDFDQALNYYNKSIDLFTISVDTQVLSRVLGNIGNIYLARGAMDTALDYYQRSLPLREDIGNVVGIATVLTNTARAYALKGNFDTALIYYNKSLELTRNVSDPSRDIIISANLFYLLRLLIIKHDTQNIDSNFELLKNISANNSDKLISQRYRLIKASLLKNNSRAIKKVEAQQIFLEISHEDVIDYELTVFASLNICELLIEEMYTSGAEDISLEVKEIIKKLFNIAIIQNSYPLLIEIYILESKLALIEFNISEAKSLLLKAGSIAKTKHLHQLIIRVSNELDSLLDQTNIWENLANQNIDLKKRIELSKLTTTITHMINNTAPNILAVKSEEPIMLLIINTAGTAIFSHTFSKQSPINVQLISAFLVSINAFGRVVFSSTESIDYIKYQEYSLLLKYIDPLLFCYAYKGNSYIAEQKIIKFVQLVHVSIPIWEGLIYTNFQILSSDKAKIISDIAEKIFFQDLRKIE